MSMKPPIAATYPSPLTRAVPRSGSSVTGRMADLKAEYAGALPSRFRRTRAYLGGRADAHYVSTLQFWQLREYARDMERNDPLIRQLVDRAVGNIIQTGMELFPQTGDKGLDEELRERFRAWGNDPRSCDAAGHLAFPEMERMVLAREIIDGDIFALPLDDGTIQIVEGDRVDSPMKMGGDLIHGVRISDAGRPIEYWFIKDRDTAKFAHVLYYAWAAEGNVDVRRAVDEDGEPVVLHVFNPQRITQTRGVTAFAPIFDYLGMIEDVQFATLVKQQIAACAAAFIERTSDFQLGARSSESQSDASTQTIEELSPGMILRGRPGEKMNMLSPNVPSSEFFEHIRLLLRIVGCTLGLPLELVLLDFTQTNFSGHRAAIQQARMGFELIQDSFPRRFHSPVYRWKARGWLAEMGRDPNDEALLRHKWAGRGWPYVDPLTDAQADKLRLDNLLVSPRDLAAERGFLWEDIVRETVEDRSAMIGSAMAAAGALSSEESPVTWRDVLNLSTPAGVTTTQTLGDPKQIEAQKDAADAKAKSDVAKVEAAALTAKEDEMDRAEMRAMLAEQETRLIRAMAEGFGRFQASTPAAAPSGLTITNATIEGGLNLPAGTGVKVETERIDLAAGSVALPDVHVHNAPAVFAPTFAPTIEAKAGETTVHNLVDVRARIDPRPQRSASVIHADGTTSRIEVDAS